MNEEAQGLIRHVLTSLGGVLVTSGYLTGSQLQDAIGAAVTVLGVAWSVYQKRQQRAALSAASAPQPKEGQPTSNAQ